MRIYSNIISHKVIRSLLASMPPGVNIPVHQDTGYYRQQSKPMVAINLRRECLLITLFGAAAMLIWRPPKRNLSRSFFAKVSGGSRGSGDTFEPALAAEQTNDGNLHSVET